MSVRDRVKILVVDDMPGQRLAIESALAELGEEVITLGSGLEALRLLLDHDVAVILLDVNMPEMDGFETASLIRQRPRSRHTPIIFLTAETNEMLAARGYSLGAVDYLFSPFLPDVLRAKVKVFVELSKMHERLKREAEQRIALSREQAARAAAEDESRRLRFLAEASGLLTRSLDPATLVGSLLALFVPVMAEFAAIVMLDDRGRLAETVWLHADAAGRLSRDPLSAAGVPGIEEALARVVSDGKAETLRAGGGADRGIVLPLMARGRAFGAMAVARPPSDAGYPDAELELLRDVASRAAVALDNSRLYQEIHERDRQKDEFLAMLSHELRNPLGAITTAVRLLEIVGPGDERARRAREVIARQSAQLARMVDDLLDVARLTAGRIVLSLHQVDLAEAVERAVDALRLSGSLDHHEVKLSLQPVTVAADQPRIEQVVTNLLVNALKYTDRGGRIDVEVFEEDGTAEAGTAVVRVRDTGIGISADMLPRLFDLFAQGHQALDRAQGGLGIGLTLVRRLVELHGGRVEASSDGPGRGSVFTVRLPAVTIRTPAGAEGSPPPRHVSLLRILVVEDNKDVRDMLRTMLELAGHEVREAENGLEALQLALRIKPQVALIDLGLPGLDGLELASRIRATDYGQGVVLVAVTGYGQPSDRKKTLEAGFDLHLTKPIDHDRLYEVLALAARRCGQRPALEPEER